MSVLARRVAVGALCTAGLVLVPISVIAANLKVSPSILLAEKYSNNLFLSAQPTVSDRVTVINPAMLITFQTADTQLGVDYGINKQIVKNSSQLDRTYQTLDVNFSAYQQDNLSFASSASIREQPISYGNATTSRIVVSNDFEEVKSGFINPSLSLEGRNYGVKADYTFGLSRYETQSNSSSNLHGVTLEVDSGRHRGPIMVSAKWSETHIDYVNIKDGSSSFLDAYLQMAYQYNSKLQFSYARGKEQNVDDRLLTRSEGYYWKTGLSFRPKSYMSLNLSSGEHYYGRSYSGALSYDRSRIIIDAGYEEETTSDARRVFAPEGGSSEPDFSSYLRVRNDIFLTKTLTSRIEYQRHRLRLHYSNSGVHRTSQGRNLFQRTYTHRFMAVYQMKREDSLTVRYDYIRIWSDPNESVSADGTLSVNYLRQFNRRLSLALDLSSRIRSASGSRPGYREKQVVATVEMSF